MTDNTITKRKAGRPSSKNGGARKNSGTTRRKSDIEHPAVQKVFRSLKKVGNNPDSNNIAELICNVVDTDIRNLIPGDVILRTQNSINTLQKINEDMVYSGGGMGFDDEKLPIGLDGEEIKQIEAKDVTEATDNIKKALPSPEIVSLDDKDGEELIDEYADYDSSKKKEEKIVHGNKEREVNEEVGVI